MACPCGKNSKITIRYPPVAGVAVYHEVPASLTPVLLSASDPKREGLIIFNDSTSVLYVFYGIGGSTAVFTDVIAAGENYRENGYTGAVSGTWLSENSGAHVSELFKS